MTVFERVAKVVNDRLNVDVDKIGFETRLEEDLGADSLDLVELSIALEEEFHVELDGQELEDDQWMNFKTVGEIAEALGGKIKGDLI